MSPATQVAIAGGHSISGAPAGLVPEIIASFPVDNLGVFGWSVTANASTQAYTLDVFVVCATSRRKPRSDR